LQQSTEDPVDVFVGLLTTVLGTGKAHVLSLGDPEDEPGPASLWGYVEKTMTVKVEPRTEFGDEEQDREPEEFEERSVWVPRGDQVGWRRYNEVYVEPKAALAAVQKLARDAGLPPIAFGPKSLGKRLDQRGMFASKVKGRNVARPTIEGVKRDVW